MATYIALVEIWTYPNGLENPDNTKETFITELKGQKPNIELGVSFEIEKSVFIPGRGDVRVFFTPLKLHSKDNIDIPVDIIKHYEKVYESMFIVV